MWPPPAIPAGGERRQKGKIFKYDVYDGSRIVLENVTSKEIQGHFGTEYFSLSYYTGAKTYYLEKYLIVEHGTGEPKPPRKRTVGTAERATATSMPEDWKREWREACSRLREVHNERINVFRNEYIL